MSTLCFILGTPKRVMPSTCALGIGHGALGSGSAGSHGLGLAWALGTAVHLAAEGHHVGKQGYVAVVDVHAVRAHRELDLVGVGVRVGVGVGVGVGVRVGVRVGARVGGLGLVDLVHRRPARRLDAQHLLHLHDVRRACRLATQALDPHDRLQPHALDE